MGFPLRPGTTRRNSASLAHFQETFRHRPRSGSSELLFAEIHNAFDPNSRFITTWQQLILMCILYEMVFIPFEASFAEFKTVPETRQALMGVYICELVFCMDIYVQLNTGYYEDGNVLRDTRKSRIKYLKSAGFVVDLLAMPPLSLLPLGSAHVVFFEFHKLIRVWRMPALITNLDNIYARYFVMQKLSKVLGLTLLMSHYVACVRHSFGYDEYKINHWLPPLPEHEESKRTKYLSSLFWAFGLLTGLFEGELPHSNVEFAFTIVVAILGFSLFTYLCATFFMISKCEGGDTETSDARVNQFKHLLAFHRVPQQLQRQAVEYLKRYYTQAETNDREAAKLLCPSISIDIQIELLQSTVSRIPVFQGCDFQFIKAVTSLLELLSYPAQFVLFRAGDHGDALYVVNSGVLHTTVNGVKVRELRKGSFFGEVAVFARLPRSATMMTTTYCTLYRLSRFHADKLLEAYPRYARLIDGTVRRMIQQTEQTQGKQSAEIPNGQVSIKGKVRRSLLQVAALKRTLTDQTGWRSKKPNTRVKPAIDADTSSIGSSASVSLNVTRASAIVAPSSGPSIDVVLKDCAEAIEQNAQGSPNDYAESPETQIATPTQEIAHNAPLLNQRTSLMMKTKNHLDGIRNTLARSSKLIPSEGKSTDAIRGFYDQLIRNAPGPTHGRSGLNKLLLPKCIDAESFVRMIWIFILQLNLCQNWIQVPLQFSFTLLGHRTWYTNAMYVAADVVLWCDLYLNFNLSFSVNSEKIVDTARSAERYFTSWAFALDLLCVWPYEIFYPAIFGTPVARLPRLLRAWRLKGHFTEVQDFFLLNSRKHLMLFGLGLLMLYHVVACLYFSITRIEGFSDEEDSWIPSDDLYVKQLNSSFYENANGTLLEANGAEIIAIRSMQYCRSLYYAANVLAALGRTIEPSSDTQFAAALLFMLSGFFITAIVVDNVQKRFTASAFEEKEFFATRTRIQLFLNRQNAPLSIYQRVNSFLDFWWSSHRGAIIGEILNELPETIKRDIVRSICTPAMETLLLLPVHSSYDAETWLHARMQIETIFLDNLRFILYGQGEIIYRQGDYAGGLFFLLEGKVEALESQHRARIIPLGGYFGIASLQLENFGVDDKGIAMNAVGYDEQVTAVSGSIVVYVSRDHLSAMQTILPPLSSALRTLDSRFQEEIPNPSSSFTQSLLGSSVRFKAKPQAPKHSWSRWVKWLKTTILSYTRKSIDPDSKFVAMWEIWIFIAITVQSVLVILRSCLGVDQSENQVYLSEDGVMIFLEICFLVDIYVRSRLGYYEYGNKVMDLRQIQNHFYHSVYFTIDVLAIIPLFLLNGLVTSSSKRLEILNLNKIFRLCKTSSQFQSFEAKYVKHAMELRLFKLVYYTFLASHMLGCIWFDFAANNSGMHGLFHSGDENDGVSFGSYKWLPGLQLKYADRSLQYVASLFWSFGLMSASSPGELPKLVSHCMFSVLTMTVGFFLFAYVVGNFSDVIELHDSENRHFIAKLSSLRRLLHHFSLPVGIEQKFKAYFFFKRFHSITQEHVLERVLPPSLLIDIRMFQLQPMIVKVAFLAGMEDSVTRMLVSLFTQVLFVQDEYICKHGEEGSEMFFIFTGVLDIYVPAAPATGTSLGKAPASVPGLLKVNQITAGSYFGEAALFTNAPRNAFVKAKTSCILYKLSRQSLELVFERYPEWKQKVLRIVKIQQEQQRLTRLAFEAQQSDVAVPGRRGLKKKLSRMDMLNNRAEAIEQQVLNQTRGGGASMASLSTTSTIRDFVKRANPGPMLRKKLKPVANYARWCTNQLINGCEIQSPFYLFWLRLVSMCTIFMAVFVPYRIAYDSLDRWNGIPVCLRMLETICEAVFLWDIWFHFRVHESHAAMELYEQNHLRAYKRERLIWDLLAAFPLDHFLMKFVGASSLMASERWLRLNRCIKVRNLIYYRSELMRRSVSHEINQLQTLWLLYLLAMFWTSCAYFAVAMHVGFGTEWQAWLPAEELDIEPDHLNPELLMLRIFRGLFFATTAFVKKGRTFVPTQLLNYSFSIAASFAGQMIMALMIGEMANVFLQYIDNEVQFRKNHLSVELFLVRWKVSSSLKRRATAFLTSWWSSHAGVDYQSIFDDLPASVRTEGILFITAKPLGAFMASIFRPLAQKDGGTDKEATMLDAFMQTIARHMRFEGYPRGESVIVEGSMCRAMYFVVRGYLYGTSHSNPRLYHAASFRLGDYFGEKGLLGHSVSLFTVTTIRACDLFVLDSQNLLEIIESHPYFRQVFAVATEMVRRQQTLTQYFESEEKERELGSAEKRRRITSPALSAQAASRKHDEHQDKDLRAAAMASQVLSQRSGGEWDTAFGLFMEMIVPNGSLHEERSRSRMDSVSAQKMPNEENANEETMSPGRRARRALSANSVVPEGMVAEILKAEKTEADNLALKAARNDSFSSSTTSVASSVRPFDGSDDRTSGSSVTGTEVTRQDAVSPSLASLLISVDVKHAKLPHLEPRPLLDKQAIQSKIEDTTSENDGIKTSRRSSLQMGRMRQLHDDMKTIKENEKG